MVCRERKKDVVLSKWNNKWGLQREEERCWVEQMEE